MSSSASKAVHVTPPRPAREGFEWVWYAEGYWAEREIQSQKPLKTSKRWRWKRAALSKREGISDDATDPILEEPIEPMIGLPGVPENTPSNTPPNRRSKQRPNALPPMTGNFLEKFQFYTRRASGSGAKQLGKLPGDKVTLLLLD